jgi:hypothetical protein
MHLFIRVIGNRVSHYCDLVAILRGITNSQLHTSVCNESHDDELMDAVLKFQVLSRGSYLRVHRLGHASGSKPCRQGRACLSGRDDDCIEMPLSGPPWRAHGYGARRRVPRLRTITVLAVH